MKQCPICNFPTKEYHEFRDGALRYVINCYKCGIYHLSTDAEHYLKSHPLNIKESTNISAWLLTNQRFDLMKKDLERLRMMNSIYVDEKADILFRAIVKYYPNPGDNIPDILQTCSKIFDLRNNESFPNVGDLNEANVRHSLYFYSISRSQSVREFQYLFENYLIRHRNFLFKVSNNFRITPEGWNYLSQLQKPNQESQIAFIAMKFDEKLKKYSDEWFEKGIKEAGYRPVRIDKLEHNNLIDDEIIANIRKSKFVIADFTYNSPGVYFESGYAKALNIPVIYLCNKECFESEENKVHFDINHYLFLLWDWDKGAELSERIRARIAATIGEGNFEELIH